MTAQTSLDAAFDEHGHIVSNWSPFESPVLIKYRALNTRPRDMRESLCKTIDNFPYGDQLVFRIQAVIFPLILPTVNGTPRIRGA